MKILIVCSTNSGSIAPFILEQGEALAGIGVVVEYFTIKGKGIAGYLGNYKKLLAKINVFNPDIIHAHYGLSGLLANIQRKVPVVTTYHGSDINNAMIFRFSRLCMMLSAHNIFVSSKNLTTSDLTRNQSLIPCGVDINLFSPIDKALARKESGLDNAFTYILFAGAFQNKVKNAVLAQAAVAGIPKVTLLELKDYSREQVALLMNAVDVALMTSFTEGSPQFVKEAMACNCPVVSVPVGDVPEVLIGVEGCYIATYEPANVAEKIRLVLETGKLTNGRKRIIDLKLDSDSVAKRILEVYNSVIIVRK
jgi:teichuronic acid biosynthesis glycosyltransferase TuaC